MTDLRAAFLLLGKVLDQQDGIRALDMIEALPFLLPPGEETEPKSAPIHGIMRCPEDEDCPACAKDYKHDRFEPKPSWQCFRPGCTYARAGADYCPDHKDMPPRGTPGGDSMEHPVVFEARMHAKCDCDPDDLSWGEYDKTCPRHRGEPVYGDRDFRDPDDDAPEPIEYRDCECGHGSGYHAERGTRHCTFRDFSFFCACTSYKARDCIVMDEKDPGPLEYCRECGHSVGMHKDGEGCGIRHRLTDPGYRCPCSCDRTGIDSHIIEGVAQVKCPPIWSDGCYCDGENWHEAHCAVSAIYNYPEAVPLSVSNGQDEEEDKHPNAVIVPKVGPVELSFAGVPWEPGPVSMSIAYTPDPDETPGKMIRQPNGDFTIWFKLDPFCVCGHVKSKHGARGCLCPPLFKQTGVQVLWSCPCDMYWERKRQPWSPEPDPEPSRHTVDCDGTDCTLCGLIKEMQDYPDSTEDLYLKSSKWEEFIAADYGRRREMLIEALPPVEPNAYSFPWERYINPTDPIAPEEDANV